MTRKQKHNKRTQTPAEKQRRKDLKNVLDYIFSDEEERDPIDEAPCGENDRVIDIFDKAFRPDREEYPPTPKGEKAYKAALEKSLEAQGKAQKICDRCPFKTQCMSESLSRPMPPHRRKSDDLRLDYDKYGVFGGTTPEYREELFDHLAQSLGYTKTDTMSGVRYVTPATRAKIMWRRRKRT